MRVTCAVDARRRSSHPSPTVNVFRANPSLGAGSLRRGSVLSRRGRTADIGFNLFLSIISALTLK